MSQPILTIVGAGPGVSLAVARRFAREGFRVALMARREDALAGYVKDLANTGADAHGFVTDAADEISLKKSFADLEARVGTTSVLVYNAAAIKQCMPSQLTADALVHEFRVNVVGAVIAAQAVASGMKAAKKGTILLTGGGLALSPIPILASLGIGKASIRNLTMSLAGELEQSGIHVATVTICGIVKPGTHFDPDKIAEAYWNLHTQEAGKWEREITYR